MVHPVSPPKLYAVSRPLRKVPALLNLADPLNPLVWLRADRGCVGVGELLRFTFTGPTRFSDAAEFWGRLVAEASIDDTVNRTASGLMAFGTFAFDDVSTVESVLIVPRLIVARKGDEAWATEISTQPINEMRALPSPRPRTAWTGTILDTTQSDDNYLAAVQGATERIERGELEKVVLARSVRGSIGAEDDLRVPLARLAYGYQNCWTYAVDGMIGASPETLVRHVEAKITARVLAGTRGRDTDADRDEAMRKELLSSEKEQHEHVFAVQSVITALSPLVSNLRVSDEPYALQLPNVWHLASDISAISNEGVSTLDIVDALHPTAAVAGTPTKAAVEAIRQLEGFDRGRYAGAVGWIGSYGDGDWVIGLRCAQVSPPADGARQVIAYAGGGIVRGSDAQHEMRETVSKFRPIAEALKP